MLIFAYSAEYIDIEAYLHLFQQKTTLKIWEVEKSKPCTLGTASYMLNPQLKEMKNKALDCE